MRAVLVDRGIPVLLAVIGTAGVAGDFNRWAGWGWATGLWVLALGLVITQALQDRQRASLRDDRLREVGAYIAHHIGEASTFEERLRGHGDLPLQTIQAEIEDWKSRVEDQLRSRLPGTHADIRFTKAIGRLGYGEVAFEHGRLVALRANLMSILDSLPSYVERSLK